MTIARWLPKAKRFFGLDKESFGKAGQANSSGISVVADQRSGLPAGGTR